MDNIPLGSIVPNEYQPRRRFDEESLAALADSIRAMGVLQPILVRPLSPPADSSDGGDADGDPGVGRYELIAGERRWRAARRAGLTTVPAIIRSIDDQRSLEEAIVENLHRSDLNPIEEAAAYQQLIDEFSLTQDEVAVRVGKSRPAVANTIRLTQLPGSIQKLVADGVLGAGHGRALLAVDGASNQRRLAQRVLDEDLSVRQVEAIVKDEIAGSNTGARGDKGSSRKTSNQSAWALEVERLLGDRFDTRVEVHERQGTGKVVINFADGDDLSRITEILLGPDQV